MIVTEESLENECSQNRQKKGHRASTSIQLLRETKKKYFESVYELVYGYKVKCRRDRRVQSCISLSYRLYTDMFSNLDVEMKTRWGGGGEFSGKHFEHTRFCKMFTVQRSSHAGFG